MDNDTLILLCMDVTRKTGRTEFCLFSNSWKSTVQYFDACNLVFGPFCMKGKQTGLLYV
jgi:hypothetical protein